MSQNNVRVNMALIAPITCTIGNFQFMVLLYEYSHYSHKKYCFWFICVGLKWHFAL